VRGRKGKRKRCSRRQAGAESAREGVARKGSSVEEKRCVKVKVEGR